MAFAPGRQAHAEAVLSSERWMAGIAADYPDGFEVAAHRHDHGQLLYPLTGVLVVEAGSGRWVVPPTTAVWLSPGVEHRLSMRGGVQVRSVFVGRDAPGGLPPADGVVQVPPLLRQLVDEAAGLGEGLFGSRRGGLIAGLLLEELRAQRLLPFHLPWPADPRMAGVCRALTDDPAHPRTAQDWAASLATSTKTFHRRFQAATGMGFGQWRVQARLLGALDAILQGRPLTVVALESGYESHSAFSLAFRKRFGVPPSRYVPGSQP